ncbi:MAG TPA: hypothetical protein VF526_09660 [Solirubrobacteraceae bacterium]
MEDPVDPEDLLPASRRAYRTSAPRTTAPSSEPIRWLVLVPDHGVESQLDALDDVVDGNVRPLQPANGRPLILF